MQTRLRRSKIPIHFDRPIQHGTRNGYRQGCGCDACRLAQREAKRQFEIRRKAAGYIPKPKKEWTPKNGIQFTEEGFDYTLGEIIFYKKLQREITNATKWWLDKANLNELECTHSVSLHLPCYKCNGLAPHLLDS